MTLENVWKINVELCLNIKTYHATPLATNIPCKQCFCYRFVENLHEEDGATVSTEEIIFRHTESTSEAKLTNVNVGKTMRALFPTAHAVRKQSMLPDKTLTTCYDGIRFTDDSDKQCIATENVATFIQSTVPICICHKISESVIKVYMESDIFCNDMPIMKSAYLNVEQGTWAMFVGKKEISLPENNIDPHFSLHINSVSTVLFFLVNFKVCMGKMASDDVTTRQLTIENIENMSNGSRERVLRSQNCSRVCSLMSTSPWPSCLSCQKIKVCKSSPSVKYINLDEADNDDLGHILNSVMSDAPPEMYHMLDGYYFLQFIMGNNFQ